MARGKRRRPVRLRVGGGLYRSRRGPGGGNGYVPRVNWWLTGLAWTIAVAGLLLTWWLI